MSSRKQLANAIRALALDAVKQANSGHSGMPMGMADIAEVLWNDFLTHNPKDPHWINRDRFILSNGHGSMLIYALLHLTGYDLSLEDIQQFRQLHSKTPGHPEFGITPGVETTTGPLGQGIANAVGMAIAERTLAANFNRDNFDIINHYTYVFLGDGCLMEGISHEACSLAGVQGLGRLIAFWDDNGISIDGHIQSWCKDDVAKRFEAYGWHVVANVDGHDPEAIKKAILEARAVTDKPSLICCKTVIAYGAPTMAGTHHAHGAITSSDEIAATKKTLDWNVEPFVIPEDIYQGWDAVTRGSKQQQAWQQKFNDYQKAYPELAQELLRRIQRQLPRNFDHIFEQLLQTQQQFQKEIATRKSSQVVLDAIAETMPELLGGSADLTDSNCTYHKLSKDISVQNPGGNYIYYGVREFGMSALMNGMALYSGFIPYGGTFLTFLDYAKNAVRMAALMKQRVVFIYTHDSIGLGEDGPTHQPIEQINSLRLTPNLSVWRPCDTVETVVAWQHALSRTDGPSSLLLSRQNLAPQQRNEAMLKDIARGGYVLKDCNGKPELILIATGSEVTLAVTAAEQLTNQGRAVRVVSMPCCDVFLAQDKAYQNNVLPNGVKKIAIEAGSTAYWYRFVGEQGAVIGIDSFGESAPAKTVFSYFGFTIEHVMSIATSILNTNSQHVSFQLGADE